MSAAQLLEDKVVVVVGVGPGLGREVAQAALRDGARVTVAARNEERLAKIANELDPSGDVLSGALLTLKGEVRHAATRELLGLPPLPEAAVEGETA